MVHLRENILFYSWKNEFYNFVIIEECYVLYTSFFNSHIFKNRTFFWIILSESRGINFERFAYRIISIASILYSIYSCIQTIFPVQCIAISFFYCKKIILQICILRRKRVLRMIASASSVEKDQCSKMAGKLFRSSEAFRNARDAWPSFSTDFQGISLWFYLHPSKAGFLESRRRALDFDETISNPYTVIPLFLLSF